MLDNLDMTGRAGDGVACTQVPYWQSRIVQGCRKRGKPVIVATNMLESMIDNPTPTRAEVPATTESSRASPNLPTSVPEP